MPTYSFGEDSPLKFEIPDKLATNYNSAVEEYFKAQRRFLQKFGRQWDPAADPIEVRWSKRQRKAWNQFAKVFDRVLTKEGPFQATEILDDFLIKNNVSAVAVAASLVYAGISAAVGLGSLYGHLRGLTGPSRG